MWLPDDGFMWTETCWSSFYNFIYFNNLRILQFVCISWTIKVSDPKRVLTIPPFSTALPYVSIATVTSMARLCRIMQVLRRPFVPARIAHCIPRERTAVCNWNDSVPALVAVPHVCLLTSVFFCLTSEWLLVTLNVKRYAEVTELAARTKNYQ